MKLVPDFFSKNRNRSYHKVLNAVEISFIGISKIRIVSQKVLKLMRFWFKLAILVFEHADGATSVNYKHFALILVHGKTLVLLTCMDLLVELNFTDQLLVDFSFVHFLSKDLILRFVYY